MVNNFDTCIIGAGWSGLMACKYFKAAGFNPVVLERNAYIGGVWQYDPNRRTGGVFSSTYTTSSKTVTEMSDFPMPRRYPSFPRHTQIAEYLRAYHDHFELGPHIRLSNGARRAARDGDGWRVEAEDGTIFQVARVVVCSGVHQEAADSGRDQLADFSGEVIHSTELEPRLATLEGKRVLIVGSGETASDVAAEVSRLTPHLALSSPHGQWFVPRVNTLASTSPLLLDHVSGPLRGLIDPFDAAFWGAWEMEFAYGRCGSGVPEWQTERPYQAQFFNKNTVVVDLWRTGQLVAKPGINAVRGARVSFRDDSAADYDVVVLCTGFETVFPFLPAPYDTRPVNEHFKLMLADDPTLSFVGFARPVVGSIPAIAEVQSRCLAAMYAGELPVPGDRDAVIARDRAASAARFQTTRLSGLVDLMAYIDELAVWLGVRPDYVQLAIRRPADAAVLWAAPFNGSRLWLHLPERRAEIVAHLREHTHPYLYNMAMWAFGLYANAFPLNPDRVYHRRRWMGLRKLIGVVLWPVFIPAGFMIGDPAPYKTAYGTLLMLFLSPIIAWRLLADRAKVKTIQRDFLPAPGARAAASGR